MPEFLDSIGAQTRLDAAIFFSGRRWSRRTVPGGLIFGSAITFRAAPFWSTAHTHPWWPSFGRRWRSNLGRYVLFRGRYRYWTELQSQCAVRFPTSLDWSDRRRIRGAVTRPRERSWVAWWLRLRCACEGRSKHSLRIAPQCFECRTR